MSTYGKSFVIVSRDIIFPQFIYSALIHFEFSFLESSVTLVALNTPSLPLKTSMGKNYAFN